MICLCSNLFFIPETRSNMIVFAHFSVIVCFTDNNYCMATDMCAVIGNSRLPIAECTLFPARDDMWLPKILMIMNSFGINRILQILTYSCVFGEFYLTRQGGEWDLPICSCTCFHSRNTVDIVL